MCKRHWKEIYRPKPFLQQEDLPVTIVGESIYDHIIPLSTFWKIKKDSSNDDEMPLIKHLKAGLSEKEAGWHRREERQSRGLKGITSLAAQFDTWERQLIMFEIMLLSGTGWNATQELAHAWAREKGFHVSLANQICERKGEMERKKRSDIGRVYTAEQRANFTLKLNKTRANSFKRLCLEVKSQKNAGSSVKTMQKTIAHSDE